MLLDEISRTGLMNFDPMERLDGTVELSNR